MRGRDASGVLLSMGDVCMASMNEKDYYAILEVDEKATTDEIRRAFQKKARKLHPDVNKEPDAEERFKEVSEAYAVLSDADKRQRYDAMRSGSPFVGGAYPGGTNVGGYGSSGFDGFPFGGTWSRRQTRSRSYNPRVGSDISFEVELDAKTASAGVRRGVTYQRYATCESCHGSGSVEHAHATTCPTCGGAGRMRIDLGGMGIFGLGFMEVTCPECEGSGKVVADPCASCGGTGRVLSASEVVIDIPEGSHDGDEVRVAGMGNAGTNGRGAGDFVCVVNVEEERLTNGQASALRMTGLGIPCILVGFIASRSLSLLSVLGFVMVGMGLAMLVRAGGRANRYWLRSAGSALLNGVLTGVVVGLLVYMSEALIVNPLFYMLIFMIVVSMMSRRTY